MVLFNLSLSQLIYFSIKVLIVNADSITDDMCLWLQKWLGIPTSTRQETPHPIKQVWLISADTVFGVLLYFTKHEPGSDGHEREICS